MRYTDINNNENLCVFLFYYCRILILRILSFYFCAFVVFLNFFFFAVRYTRKEKENNIYVIKRKKTIVLL